MNKSKKRFSILKILAYFFATVASIAVVAHFYWKYTGSNSWELRKTVDGVTVYTLKEPGSSYLKFKVVGTFNAKLSSIMKVMRDPEACEEIGCYDFAILETVDYPRYQFYKFTYPYGAPFKPRQYVGRSEFRQDPVTKAIYADYKSVNDRLPEDDCCVRVTHMHNIWTFTPLKGGSVQVEFVMNEIPGGFLPYFLFNSIVADTIHKNVPDLQKILDMDKYRNAVVDYVVEVDPDPSNTSTQDSSLNVNSR